METHSKKIIIPIVLGMIVFLANSIYSQEQSYLLVAETMPQPQGGLPELYKKIKYPAQAKKAGISGKVFLQAFINEQGSVDDVKIIKGIGAGCDEAAVDGIKSCQFDPAKNEGKSVKARLSIAITF